MGGYNVDSISAITMTIARAKEIFGEDFIGPDELNSVADKFDIPKIVVENLQPISFTEDILMSAKGNFILILGVPNHSDGRALTISSLRDIFGTDPSHSEPCMYNQDWYLRENFASNTSLDNKWHLVRKEVIDSSRGEYPDRILLLVDKNEAFPSAILTTFSFFCMYIIRRKILWPDDYVWCEDKDHNGDRIYTGRYFDKEGINKNGFNIHRHLSIRNNYGLAPVIN
ncbi:MAG: hypothetical protein HY226_05015 [Candidatus Vogelbacteria bacterium]|nr:hypothetical protein [Candidatus Vogelbacteria bacterium]